MTTTHFCLVPPAPPPASSAASRSPGGGRLGAFRHAALSAIPRFFALPLHHHPDPPTPLPPFLIYS
jgi:hypothetical protein